MIAGALPICKYLCKASGSLLGNGNLEQTKIEQWVYWTAKTLEPTCAHVLKGIFGSEEIYQGSWNDASKELKSLVKLLQNALAGNQWLVGNSMSLADIFVATTLLAPFQTVLDGGFRKAMKDVTAWADKIFALP